jgi:hypothetical protein
MSSTLYDSNHVPEAEIGTVTLPLCDFILVVLTCHRCIGDHPSDHPYGPYPPQSGLTQAIQGETNFIDGSGPIFSMYLEMAGEEDKKMVEGWKADADGILIFVRFCLIILSLTNTTFLDRFILCCCRVLDLSVHPGHSIKPAGHLQLLPRKHLSSYC